MGSTFVLDAFFRHFEANRPNEMVDARKLRRLRMIVLFCEYAAVVKKRLDGAHAHFVFGPTICAWRCHFVDVPFLDGVFTEQEQSSRMPKNKTARTIDDRDNVQSPGCCALNCFEFSVLTVKDRPQRQRNEISAQFQSGVVDVLVGTNVLARGLDFPEVEMVINLRMSATVGD
ncbi:hypothetical protein M3Y94_00007400 [Aphelenchoides besseyi]|nr:hypothetical protein M3Y94_00007400 [Aphelenchoides besseyi]